MSTPYAFRKPVPSISDTPEQVQNAYPNHSIKLNYCFECGSKLDYAYSFAGACPKCNIWVAISKRKTCISGEFGDNTPMHAYEIVTREREQI